MTKNNQPGLDAVKMMRAIRDELSRKLMKMSHEEQRRHIKEQMETEGRIPEEEPRQWSST